MAKTGPEGDSPVLATELRKLPLDSGRCLIQSQGASMLALEAIKTGELRLLCQGLRRRPAEVWRKPGGR